MDSLETNSVPVKPEELKPGQGLVRCKICGYVTEAGRIREVCPACGVKATLFEPFTEKFSLRRWRILSWHLHPVVVHLPQAFSFMLAVLLVCMLMLHGSMQMILASAALVLIVAMPIAALGSFLTGILDGRTRFRKLSAPYLRIKLISGGIYFALALANAILVAGFPWVEGSYFGIVAALSMIQFGLTVVLGKIGADIACARMPG